MSGLTCTSTPSSSTLQCMKKELKQCGHYCYPSSLASCCACEDLRPMAAAYETYVDGTGYTMTGERDDGYCGVCNTKNYDKWMERVEREIRKKKAEDEEKMRLEMERVRLADEDREKAKLLDDEEDQRVEYSNGDVYVGKLKDGERHGFGKMEYGDNDMDMLFYEGMWEGGVHCGHGMKRWIDDMWYEGEWKDGKMHGKGKCFMNADYILEGTFEDDEFCG